MGTDEVPKISSQEGVNVSLEQISERLCEQIGVIEVPKISRAGLESKRQLDEAELALEANQASHKAAREELGCNQAVMASLKVR